MSAKSEGLDKTVNIDKVHLSQHFPPLWILVLSPAHSPGECSWSVQYKVNGNLAIILLESSIRLTWHNYQLKWVSITTIINTGLQVTGYRPLPSVVGKFYCYLLTTDLSVALKLAMKTTRQSFDKQLINN